MRRVLFIGSLCLAALLALLISATNPSRVEIELAFGRLVSPLGLALVIAFTLGLLCGLAGRMYWVAELLTERGRLRRALRMAEASARSNAAAEDSAE
ncbi:putative integral membrane protein [Povalibacter uvarum]|uniref:Putative integral membrane protein n=1 Tax=Povalibacter uvarum TaxID=732238 RepID=A0A841HGZ2_9GAMM|nr:LapA family protein [Povalibacter uvarum]MBB6091943.1 putative integral membrane protein [Povalibacter uvarum]